MLLLGYYNIQLTKAPPLQVAIRVLKQLPMSYTLPDADNILVPGSVRKLKKISFLITKPMQQLSVRSISSKKWKGSCTKRFLNLAYYIGLLPIISLSKAVIIYLSGQLALRQADIL